MVCAVAAGFFLLRFDIDVAMMSQMSTNRIHAPATLVEIHPSDLNNTFEIMILQTRSIHHIINSSCKVVQLAP